MARKQFDVKDIKLAQQGKKRIDWADQFMQVVRKALRIRHATVVREIDTLGLITHQTVDGDMQGGRIELNGSGGREDECPALHIELAVRNPEGIDREDAAARLVHHTVMMARMTGRIQQKKLPAIQVEREPIARLDHPLRRHRHDLTVTRLGPDRYLIVTGSAQTTRDADWIRRNIPETAHAVLTDVGSAYSVMSVMGPRSRDLLACVSKADFSNTAFPFATMREIDLGYARVTAPIAGRAGKQQVTEGALVGQGEATLLTTVDQLDPLYANFSISSTELEQLRGTEANPDQGAVHSDWSKVSPEIFGAIFQESMEAEERHAFGAHFTSAADIMKIVKPTISDPWKEAIESAKTGARLNELLGAMR